MVVTVRLFAALRETAGRGEMEWQMPDGATAGDVVAGLRERLPALDAGLRRAHIAVNRQYAAANTLLRDGDEVALFPPVSGG